METGSNKEIIMFFKPKFDWSGAHKDHGLTDQHIAELERKITEMRPKNGLLKVTVETENSELECGLVGMTTHGVKPPLDLVYYGLRGNRRWASRMALKSLMGAYLTMIKAGFKFSADVRRDIYRHRALNKGEGYSAKDIFKTRQLSCIGMVKDGQIEIWTAFGGPIAPREPWDCETKEEQEESFDFWEEHVLLGWEPSCE